jgi:hypothetical protein
LTKHCSAGSTLMRQRPARSGTLLDEAIRPANFAVARYAKQWQTTRCSWEDLIAIERVAQKLWRLKTNGTSTEWEALSVLAKQAWRNRARMEVTIWRKSVGRP